MGINGLGSEIKKVQKDTCLKDIKIAVDGNSFTYWFWRQHKSYLGYYNQGDDLINFINSFENVTFVFVFDGVSTHHKQNTLHKRKKRKNKQFDDFLSWAIDGKNRPKQIPLAPLFMSELISTLKKIGVEVIGAKGEADNTLPFLPNINGILSSDSDFILSNKGTIPLYLLHTLNRSDNTIKYVKCYDLLNLYRIKFDTLMLSCLYCGTDKVQITPSFNSLDKAIQFIKSRRCNFSKRKLKENMNRYESIKDSVASYEGVYSHLEFIKGKHLWAKCLGNYKLSDTIILSNRKPSRNTLYADIISASKFILKCNLTLTEKTYNKLKFDDILNMIGDYKEITSSYIKNSALSLLTSDKYQPISSEHIHILHSHTTLEESEPQFPLCVELIRSAKTYQYVMLSLIEFLELLTQNHLVINYNELFNEKQLWTAMKMLKLEAMDY